MPPMPGTGQNGMPAADLPGVAWRRSSVTAAGAPAVEVASLGGGEFAVRNSADPAGPALVYTQPEMAALVEGVKRGEFDDLLGDDPLG
jgi:uncharacterized protein DUF397